MMHAGIIGIDWAAHGWGEKFCQRTSCFVPRLPHVPVTVSIEDLLGRISVISLKGPSLQAPPHACYIRYRHFAIRPPTCP